MGRGCRFDIHSHVVVDLPDFADRFGDPRWPTFSCEAGVGTLTRDGQVVRALAPSAWLTSPRIEDLDAAGIDRQVVSPIPPLICATDDPVRSRIWAECINAGIADMVRERPDRLAGLGTVPLRHPHEAVKVLEGAHDAGLVGVEIGADAGDRELDHPDLLEFFQAADELSMLIFVHPLILGVECDWTPRITGLVPTFGLGMTTDTAIAATRLVFGGVTQACPGLRVCLAHGGGTFPWALSRIAHLWDSTHTNAAADLVRNVFVDSVVYRPANLRFLVDQMGVERVLFGTDYPLPAQDDLGGGVMAGLTSREAELVGGLNAVSLFGGTAACR